jgi:CheY-like chemotaxis protein
LPLLALREAADSITGLEDRLPPRSAETEGSNVRRLDGLRVLIVDDQADARQVIGMMLQQSGAETATATSVTEALEIIGNWLPDVLVSDIALPGQDGYCLIRELRSRSAEQGGQIPALAITAYARTEDRVRILSSGFQLHVTKPVEPIELVAAVATLVNRRNIRP